MTKANRIKKLQEALLESHQKLISGEISNEQYSRMFKDTKLRIREIKQEK